MTHPSKRKGNGFEREIVEAAEKMGLPAKRAWGSNGAALGKCAEVDVLVDDMWCLQAKRRAKLPAYLEVPKGCHAVVFRQDHGEPMVLLPLDAWLVLIGGA